MKKKYIKLFCLFSCFLLYFFMKYLFFPIFNCSTLIFPYAINPFDIVNKYPKAWQNIKLTYCITFFISTYVLLNSFFSIIALNLKIPVYKKVKLNRLLFSSKINLLLGKNSFTEEKIYITEKSLYQNILITGTIGSRQNKFCNGTISKTAY